MYFQLKLTLTNALANLPSISSCQDPITNNVGEEVTFFVPGPRIELSGCSNLDDMKITVKLMLSNADPSVATQAVSMGTSQPLF